MHFNLSVAIIRDESGEYLSTFQKSREFSHMWWDFHVSDGYYIYFSIITEK